MRINTRIRTLNWYFSRVILHIIVFTTVYSLLHSFTICLITVSFPLCSYLSVSSWVVTKNKKFTVNCISNNVVQHYILSSSSSSLFSRLRLASQIAGQTLVVASNIIDWLIDLKFHTIHFVIYLNSIRRVDPPDCKLINDYLIGEKEQGDIHLEWRLTMFGTVIATHSSQPGLRQAFSRTSFRTCKSS